MNHVTIPASVIVSLRQPSSLDTIAIHEVKKDKNFSFPTLEIQERTMFLEKFSLSRVVDIHTFSKPPPIPIGGSVPRLRDPIIESDSISTRGVRVYAAKSSGGTGGAKEEKGPFDWILKSLAKEEQFYETNPLFKKGEEEEDKKNNSSVAVPQKNIKKNGETSDGGFPGFGGFFAKK
ncbi:hypothetical protein ACFE04_015492 [Oxalis oulophora]